MKVRLSDLWSVRGTVDRGTYAFWGIALALLKYNVDRFVAWRTIGRPFRAFDYWIPGDLFGVLPMKEDG